MRSKKMVYRHHVGDLYTVPAGRHETIELLEVLKSALEEQRENFPEENLLWREVALEGDNIVFKHRTSAYNQQLHPGEVVLITSFGVFGVFNLEQANQMLVEVKS